MSVCSSFGFTSEFGYIAETINDINATTLLHYDGKVH